MKNNIKEHSPADIRPNALQHFLLICSGSNVHQLRKAPTEWNKFSGIGGVILFTAVFAALSAGYAMFTVFDDAWISVAFAVLWGLMIFNLDRYIVSSMKKTGAWWQQLLMALPRLILAGFLGVIISKPLELKIFEKEVNKQLNTIIQRNKAQLQKEMNGRILQQSTPFENEKQAIQTKIADYQKSYDSAAVELEKEILGKESGLTSGKVGYGPNAKRKAELKEQRRADLENYQKQIAPRLNYLDQEVAKVYSNVEKEREKTETAEDRFTGFAARLQALDELGENSAVIAVAASFIMGLFICLEIAPVLVKLISSAGPYDYLLENTESGYRQYAAEKIRKRDLVTEHRIRQLEKELEEKP